MLFQRAVHRLVIQTILKIAPHPAVNHKAVQEVLSRALGEGLEGGPKDFSRSL
ncbi:MAG: hypothetical protein HYZ74_00755 [Elusimicrobia bacterium]|nr:hypothetical protein [Elusimicrobiota bacterium]